MYLPLWSIRARQEEVLGVNMSVPLLPTVSWSASTCVLWLPRTAPSGVCLLSPQNVWNTLWQSPEEGWGRAARMSCLPCPHALCYSFLQPQFPQILLERG